MLTAARDMICATHFSFLALPQHLCFSESYWQVLECAEYFELCTCSITQGGATH